ncbi:protein NPGR2 [Daucus carota subsp. sativus]|nr:PREDICTED: tetratricopeptide repeat protein 7A-like [Daucus carota subsp. sativus]XP_017236531.1 PREDICTED: tetratricopeptide repeat protein 7A-like [Daucus carota subsp. sativus]
MRSKNPIKERGKQKGNKRLGNLMACLQSPKKNKLVDMIYSSKSPAKDYSRSAHSSRSDEIEHQLDVGNIEEAESSLRESGSLNYEEARALLGRYEYQKGNIEAALHVFEGIDIATITPKVRITLGSKGDTRKQRSRSFATLPMSVRTVSLILEAILLKAKSLQVLGRYKEAAQSCAVVLDIVESSLPTGLPEDFAADCKMHETLNNSVELLPELWKLVDSPREVIFSYRRALLHKWNLDTETTAKIQKEFAVYLLYSGGDAFPPNLRFQMDRSYVPKNNMEEAILLLMILLRKISLKKIEWDPTILDHLSYALSICGGLSALATELVQLLPGVIKRNDRYHSLALCHYGEGDELGALNLWRKVLKSGDDSDNIQALLMASKICGQNSNYVEGTEYALRALENVKGTCDARAGVASSLLGISLSAHSKSNVTDSERAKIQSESLLSLETAGKMTKLSDPGIIYQLSLENAEQRKLDAALYYAKLLLKLEGGSNIVTWILVARILSAKKRFYDAETIINAALDQTGKWDQGELLRTKAKLQIAQGQLKSTIKTYTELLAVLQVRSKSFGSENNLLEDAVNWNKSLEMDAWHNLAFVYISLLQWRDAEICLSKSKAIKQHSASRWHATGVLFEAKGFNTEALRAFEIALDEDPKHVPSLVSMAVVLKQVDGPSLPVVRSFLTEALRLDRMNSSAWYNLGLLYKDQGITLAREAADCFEAATMLEETAPVEPFR